MITADIHVPYSTTTEERKTLSEQLHHWAEEVLRLTSTKSMDAHWKLRNPQETDQ
jgi:hypothetical protein